MNTPNPATLVLAVHADRRPRPAARFPPARGQSVNSRRVEQVLVVDDQPFNRALIERLLELDGYRTCAAGSIAEAAQIVARAHPALIILDLRLPDGDGLGLARRLRMDPATAGGAIVACSAALHDDERDRALAAGCDAYVSKPIDISGFGALVDTLMADYRWRSAAVL